MAAAFTNMHVFLKLYTLKHNLTTGPDSFKN